MYKEFNFLYHLHGGDWKQIDKKFIMDRITELRLKRNVSERQMSREMGHSPTYLSNLAAYKGYPSLEVVLDCCRYFGISLSDFFQEDLTQESTAAYIANKLIELFDEEDRIELIKLVNAMDKHSAKALVGILKNYSNTYKSKG